MVKEIVRDTIFLMQKSNPATRCQEDLQTAKDLLDTLSANSEKCVGMAANMIGVSKNIIVVSIKDENVIMFNPRIIEHSKNQYDADEGCLSLDGTRSTKRYDTIVVEYQDRKFKKNKKQFSGFEAQIIQHEIDHCYGIII